MKANLLILFCLILVLSGCSSIKEDSISEGSTTSEDKNILMESEEKKLKLQIGDKNYSALLYDSPTNDDLEALLPLKLSFSELNGNEYYAYLDQNLQSAPEKIGDIEVGDIMLYNSNCLVLFYESFSSNYSYTPIGKIIDPTGIAEALSSNNWITISLE